MRLLNLVQGSEEWHEWRKSKITATDCATIMGKNPFCSPYRLWKQKTLGEEIICNEDMQRGNCLEDEARRYFSRTRGCDYKPVCAENDQRSWQGASMDGFCQDDQGLIYLLEIKCPREKKVVEMMKTVIIPDYWLYQMQHQMSVFDADMMEFLAYTEKPDVLFSKFIYRDEKLIQEINEAEERFYYDYMCALVPPPLNEAEQYHQYILREMA